MLMIGRCDVWRRSEKMREAIATAIEHSSRSPLKRHRCFVSAPRFTQPLIGLVLLSTALTLRASAPQNREAAYLSEVHAAMMTMHIGMAVQPTGDVDTDFVAMMIPHHQGAIDMARAELRYGHNEKLARIAQEIIVTQQQEIAAMRLSVGEPLASSRASPDQQDPRTASRSNLNKWFTQEP
jgi:Domain of unknown function (DUF305)